MLVAINPYEILPIYTNNEITNYRNRKIGDLPPHIFAIGDSAFQEILRENLDQCIVISGESGECSNFKKSGNFFRRIFIDIMKAANSENKLLNITLSHFAYNL